MTALLDPGMVDPVPWDNGAGSTRELAVKHDPDGRILWRVSVADLDQNAGFSCFPGLERLFVALGPLVLAIDGRGVILGAGEAVSFAGEAEVAVRLDRPTRALNVMTRRGAARADVHLRDHCAPAHPGVSLSIDVRSHVADVLLATGTSHRTLSDEGSR